MKGSRAGGDPPQVSVVMVLHDEPIDRIGRAVRSLVEQVGVAPFELVIAAPSAEHAGLEGLRASGRVKCITLVDNPGAGRSAGLNAATDVAEGAILVRLDARSVLPKDYVG